MNQGFISFCPDVGGPCVGPGCAACLNGMQINIESHTNIINKLILHGNLDSLNNYTGILPLSLMLDCYICTKYNKFIDPESYQLFSELINDFNYEIDN